MSADIANILQQLNVLDRKWSEIFSGRQLFLGKTTHLQMAQIIFKQQEMGKPIVASELAKRLNISKAAISQVLTKWEHEGLIERYKHENENKKLVYIIFKENIYQDCLACKDELVNSFANIIKVIGIEKVEQFIQLVHEIQDILAENQDLIETFIAKIPHFHKKFI